MLLQTRVLASATAPTLRSSHRHTLPIFRVSVQTTAALVWPISLSIPFASRRHKSSDNRDRNTQQQLKANGRKDSENPGDELHALPPRPRELEDNNEGGSLKDGQNKKERTKPMGPKHIGALLTVEDVGESLKLFFEGQWPGNPSEFSKLWFRDACPCEICVSPSSGQKRFATCSIPSDIQMDSCRVLDDGSLEVVWNNDFLRGEDKHISTYPLVTLHDRLLYPSPHFYSKPVRHIWDRDYFKADMESRSIDYTAWMDGGSAFVKAFMDLYQWGLIFIDRAPSSEDTVEQIASKIGHLQSTFYGRTWDVQSKPSAENVAYTNEFLGLHQDLLYIQNQPKIQILHCVENSCSGGESLFSDGVRAAYDMLFNHRRKYHDLGRQRVHYQYGKNGHYYNRSRLVINGGTDFRGPREVCWSPPFQANFYSRFGSAKLDRSLRLWRSAAEVFKESLEAPQNVLRRRLQPGTVVVFDNTRILHGRSEFDTSSGHRHLRGGYLDNQVFTSAYKNLVKQGLVDFPRHHSTGSEEWKQARELLGRHVEKMKKDATIAV